MFNGSVIGVGRINFETLSQQIDKVSAVSTSGVKNAHAWRDVSTQNLIENVDIDLPKDLLNTQSHSNIIYVSDNVSETNAAEAAVSATREYAGKSRITNHLGVADANLPVSAVNSRRSQVP
jgi:hypothetical protein